MNVCAVAGYKYDGNNNKIFGWYKLDELGKIVASYTTPNPKTKLYDNLTDIYVYNGEYVYVTTRIRAGRNLEERRLMYNFMLDYWAKKGV